MLRLALNVCSVLLSLPDANVRGICHHSRLLMILWDSKTVFQLKLRMITIAETRVIMPHLGHDMCQVACLLAPGKPEVILRLV